MKIRNAHLLEFQLIVTAVCCGGAQIPRKVQAVHLNNPENMEQAWVKDNGHKKSGTVKLRFYPDLPPSYDAAHFGLPQHLQTSDSVNDGSYTWHAFFKRGVIGVDGNTLRYFMIYLPEDRYDWIRKLAVRGQWLYMSNECFNSRVYSEDEYHIQDQDCTWSLRYNKRTHALEQGKFDEYVQQGILSAKSSEFKKPSDIKEQEVTEPDYFRYFRAWVRREPANARAHYVLGGMLLDKGNASLDEAITELRVAILLDPQMDGPHTVLAGALMRKGEKDEALKEAEIGLKLWRQGR